ncbi:MAG: hypothetical protein ACRDO4_04295 [Nocardioides sp.]
MDSSAQPAVIEDGVASPGYVVELPAKQVAIVDELRADYERWAGDFATQQAVEVINAYAHNADQQECVEARGLEWTPGWRGAIQPVSTWQWHTGNVKLTPPTRVLSYDNVLNAPAESLQPLLRIEPQPPLDAVLDECSFQIDSAGRLLGEMSSEELGALLRPNVVSQLNQRWFATMDAAVADVGVDAKEIGACFADSDLSGDLGEIEPGDAGEYWWEQVGQQLDASRAPSLDQTATAGSASWVSAVNAEADLVTALWQCHASDYGESLAAALAAADRFAQEKGAEIAQAEAAWVEVKSLAGKMGWTPTEPLAGLSAADVADLAQRS